MEFFQLSNFELIIDMASAITVKTKNENDLVLELKVFLPDSSPNPAQDAFDKFWSMVTEWGDGEVHTWTDEEMDRIEKTGSIELQNGMAISIYPVPR